MNNKQIQIRNTIASFINNNKYYDAVKWLIDNFQHSYFVMLKKQYCEKILNAIIDNTTFLEDDVDLGTRVWHYINNKTTQETCLTCGKKLKKILPTDKREHHFCSNRCAQLDPENKKKIADTKEKNKTRTKDLVERQKKRMLDKYGVESAFQLEAVKQKTKQTLYRKYGVDHQMHSAKVKDKIKQTNLKKYGTESTFASKYVIDKIKNTNQQRYGVDYPMQSKKIRDIMHKNAGITQKTNFYNNILLNNKDIQPLFSLDDYIQSDNKLKVFKWKCRHCEDIFESRIVWGNNAYVRCLKCNPIEAGTSKFEKDIVNSLKKCLPSTFEVINQTNENNLLLKPQQIDIIVKKNGKIALLIEADGLFWHSDAAGKTKDYHISKTELCQQKGFQLVHVFEDEWKDKKEIVLSRLLSLLGIYDNTIYARQCEVVEVEPRKEKIFLEENHLQGKCRSKVCLGLKKDNQLIALMSFGARRKALGAKNIDGYWEMLRFCAKNNTHVIGAAGKLLKTFEKKYKPIQLTSYADRRWSTGKLYSAIGFKLDHISQPSYWYLDENCQHRYFRFMFRKSELKKQLEHFDATKTEQQNMINNGWHIIWDCGNYVFMKQY